MKKMILKIMLGSVILEALLVCIFILVGNFDEIAWRAIDSVGIIFIYSIPCLFYSKIYNDEKYKYIVISGSVIVCISALINILSLWDLFIQGEFFEKLIVTFNVMIWMLAFISWILSFVSANNLLNLFKKINMFLILSLSCYITITTWTEFFPQGFLARLYYVLIVLTIGSFICILILKKIYKKEIVQLEQKMYFNDNHTTQNNFVNNTSEMPTNEVSIQSQNTTQSTINSAQTINYSKNIQQDSSTEDELSNNNESNTNSGL